MDSTIQTQHEALCIVMAFGTFKGGDICYLEVGLRVTLESEDWVAFNSKRYTHFNTDFTGQRGSIVLHSDFTLNGWMGDLNGWNNCLRTSYWYRAHWCRASDVD
jgi:hypothetical protein